MKMLSLLLLSSFVMHIYAANIKIVSQEYFDSQICVYGKGGVSKPENKIWIGYCVEGFTGSIKSNGFVCEDFMSIKNPDDVCASSWTIEENNGSVFELYTKSLTATASASSIDGTLNGSGSYTKTVAQSHRKSEYVIDVLLVLKFIPERIYCKNPYFTQEAKDIAKNPNRIKEFAYKFGDIYLAGGDLGGKLLVNMRHTITSTEGASRQQIVSSLNAKYKKEFASEASLTQEELKQVEWMNTHSKEEGSIKCTTGEPEFSKPVKNLEEVSILLAKYTDHIKIPSNRRLVTTDYWYYPEEENGERYYFRDYKSRVRAYNLIMDAVVRSQTRLNRMANTTIQVTYRAKSGNFADSYEINYNKPITMLKVTNDYVYRVHKKFGIQVNVDKFFYDDISTIDAPAADAQSNAFFLNNKLERDCIDYLNGLLIDITNYDREILNAAEYWNYYTKGYCSQVDDLFMQNPRINTIK